jgi:hypothetical protein
MQTDWIRFPEDSTRTAKWKYSVTYVFRATRILGSTSADPFTKSDGTEVFKWCTTVPCYTSMCTTWHTQDEHFDTGANYVHLDHVVVLILDSLFTNGLCLRTWYISNCWCMFLLTKCLNFRPSTFLMINFLWNLTMGQGTLPFWVNLYFRRWRIPHSISTPEDYLQHKRSYGSATHLSVRDVRL